MDAVMVPSPGRDGPSEARARSHDMEPVHGSVDLDMPAAWPRWNSCLFWCANRTLKLGDRLIWSFDPIRPWYGYRIHARRGGQQ